MFLTETNFRFYVFSEFIIATFFQNTKFYLFDYDFMNNRYLIGSYVLLFKLFSSKK